MNGQQLKEGGRLPPTWSAQTTELCVLVRACELYRDETVNIFTDSNYAYGVIHVFGKLRKMFINLQGKEVS